MLLSSSGESLGDEESSMMRRRTGFRRQESGLLMSPVGARNMVLLVTSVPGGRIQKSSPEQMLACPKDPEIKGDHLLGP